MSIQEFKEFWDLTYNTFIKNLGDLKKISWARDKT